MGSTARANTATSPAAAAATIALTFLVVNLVADLLYLLVDPRIRVV